MKFKNLKRFMSKAKKLKFIRKTIFRFSKIEIKVFNS